MSTAQFVTSMCITGDKHDFILFEAENELDFTDSSVRPFHWGADSMFPG